METLEGRRAHFRDRWRQQLLSDVPEREAAAEPEYRRYFGSLTVAGRREALEAAIRNADRFALRSVLVSPAPRALSGLSEVELEHFGDQARKALDPEGDRMADDYRRAHGAVLMAGAMYAELLRSHHRYSGPGIPAWAWSTVAEVASATPIRLERVHAPDLPPAAA